MDVAKLFFNFIYFIVRIVKTGEQAHVRPAKECSRLITVSLAAANKFSRGEKTGAPLSDKNM